MRKRAFSLALVLCMVLALLPVGVQAAEIIDSGSCGENVTWTLDSSGLLTISGEGEMWQENIDAPWYNYREQIKSATLSEGITSLCAYAFGGCEQLQSVSLPDSLTEIGGGAFSTCSALSEIYIPQNVQTIGAYAFYDCEELQKVCISDLSAWCEIAFRDDFSNPLRYAHNLYLNGELLKEIIIPEGTQIIGDNAFFAADIKKVVIPDSVTSIGNNAFYLCSQLESINIPDSVCAIGTWAFYYCNELRSITLPDSMTSISDGTFQQCTSLESVSFPEQLEYIGGYAFYQCRLSNGIVLPDTLSIIGPNAFENCSLLQNVVIPGHVEEITACAFKNCSNLKSVDISAGVSSVGNEVFSLCRSLKSLSISDSVKSIGYRAFNGCDALTDVSFDGTRAQWNAVAMGRGNDPLLKVSIHCTDGDIVRTCLHEETTVMGKKPATCSEPGYTGDTVCTVCGEIIQQGETIPTSPHTWSAWVTTVKPTETSVGYEVRSCLVCGASETNVIPKLPPAGPFIDVPAGAYYHDAVLWAYGHEPQITTGVTANTFDPNRICIRAQVVTFLWRAAGEPEPKLKVNPFRDVDASAYCYKAVLWALENGITTGNTATTFNPTGECTRAQVVTFLWRAAGEPAPESMNNPFGDVSNSAYYCKAVLWAREQGITTGNTPTTFNPTGKCTRAHVVTFLYRAFGE